MGVSVVILSQGEVLLRPWQVSDAQWYVDARDEEVLRWTTEPPKLTVDETVAAIEAVNAREDVFSFAVVDLHRNELAGNVAVVKSENYANEGEVMYWLAKTSRGRGIAAKAVGLLCDWGFTELGLERLTLKTYTDNVRSQGVAERVGFRQFRPANENGEKPQFVWYELTKQMRERGNSSGQSSSGGWMDARQCR